MADPARPAPRTTLRPGATALRGVVYRFLRRFGLVCAAWTAVLAATAPDHANSRILGATVLTIVVWSIVSLTVPTRVWGAGWLLVAAALELAGPAAGTDGWSLVGGATFLVIAAAAASGRRRNVVVVVAVLAVATLARPALSPGWNVAGGISTLLIFALGATALTWLMRVITATVEQRDQLATDLAAAERDRAVTAEREEAAARLHDSVLQTLAQAERSAPDRDVARLIANASADLRAFLRHGTTGGTVLSELDQAVAAAAGDERARVGFTHIGTDRVCDEPAGLLVAATAEAVRNAAKHTAGPVRVTCELREDAIVVWISDRGPGFDLDEVPEDRLGVRESIAGRMERAGGSATPRRRPSGFEWELSLPHPT